MRHANFLPLTAFSLLMACGGGGGSGNPVASPDPTLSIDSNNAMLVAKVSYESALASGGLGSLSGNGLLIGSAPDGVAKFNDAVVAAAKLGASQAQVPVPAETTPCASSGAVTVSGEIADPITPTLSPGDFFEIDYDACDDGLGDVIDGVMRLSINSFSGDFLGELFEMNVTLTLNTFQVTTGQDVTSSHGDATVSLNTLMSPTVSTSLSGNSMRIDANAMSELLTNYSSAITVDGGLVPSPNTMSASGTLDSTQLSGIIGYSTPVTFTGFGSEYPSSGQFLVSGGASSLRLIAIDNVNVSIELDTNGDGTVDETLQTTWVELGV
jgi:hypothetical protein